MRRQRGGRFLLGCLWSAGKGKNCFLRQKFSADFMPRSCCPPLIAAPSRAFITVEFQHISLSGENYCNPPRGWKLLLSAEMTGRVFIPRRGEAWPRFAGLEREWWRPCTASREANISTPSTSWHATLGFSSPLICNKILKKNPKNIRIWRYMTKPVCCFSKGGVLHPNWPVCFPRAPRYWETNCLNGYERWKSGSQHLGDVQY